MLTPAGTPGSTGENEMVEHQGIAPCIPVWKVLADGHQRVSLNTYAREEWNPVLELHQPLRFCKPPPELLGQRDYERNFDCATGERLLAAAARS